MVLTYRSNKIKHFCILAHFETVQNEHTNRIFLVRYQISTFGIYPDNVLFIILFHQELMHYSK